MTFKVSTVKDGNPDPRSHAWAFMFNTKNDQASIHPTLSPKEASDEKGRMSKKS
jgi:hypothetical protein